MAEGLPISQLPLYRGGFNQAVEDNAMFPVAVGDISNAKVGAREISAYTNQLVVAALSGKAELSDLESLWQRVSGVEISVEHVTNLLEGKINARILTGSEIILSETVGGLSSGVQGSSLSAFPRINDLVYSLGQNILGFVESESGTGYYIRTIAVVSGGGGDPLQLVHGDGSFTPGFLDVITNEQLQTGDFINVPRVPSYSGMLACYSADKLMCMLLGLNIGCMSIYSSTLQRGRTSLPFDVSAGWSRLAYDSELPNASLTLSVNGEPQQGLYKPRGAGTNIDIKIDPFDFGSAGLGESGGVVKIALADEPPFASDVIEAPWADYIALQGAATDLRYGYVVPWEKIASAQLVLFGAAKGTHITVNQSNIYITNMPPETYKLLYFMPYSSGSFLNNKTVYAKGSSGAGDAAGSISDNQGMWWVIAGGKVMFTATQGSLATYS